MSIIRLSEAPRFELPGLEFTALAAPSRGSAGLCTWRLAVAAGVVSPAPHTIDHDEVFMVMSGSVRLAADGELLHAGDTPAEVIVAIRAGFTAKGADGTPIGTPPWAL